MRMEIQIAPLFPNASGGFSLYPSRVAASICILLLARCDRDNPDPFILLESSSKSSSSSVTSIKPREIKTASNISSLAKGVKNPMLPPATGNIGGTGPEKTEAANINKPSPPSVTTRSGSHRSADIFPSPNSLLSLPLALLLSSVESDNCSPEPKPGTGVGSNRRIMSLSVSIFSHFSKSPLKVESTKTCTPILISCSIVSTAIFSNSSSSCFTNSSTAGGDVTLFAVVVAVDPLSIEY
mmetsp:Transcript_33422/g.60218  ORF Transcript_33422/g.60218 Transcript_33422/m.60218 type:complete len:239 (-) Transcript_33422:598-1314(-)